MSEPGDLENLVVQQIEPESPKKGEISIAVRAVGLNFRDVMAATGLLPPGAEDKPAWQRLGMECAGVVEAVGKGVKRIQVGDPVIATAKGAFKSSLVIPELAAWKQPEGLTHVEAATLLSAFSTAYYSLITVGRLRKGERVLIHLATGGVGLAAVQVAKMVGAEIFATAGSPEKRDYLRSLGIEHVMDSRSLDFAEQTLQLTDGQGVDVVLNALAGEAIERGLSILAPCGRFLEIGKRDIYADSPIGMRALRKNISFMAIDMARMGEDNPEGLAEVFQEIGELLEDGKLKPIPAETFPINKSTEAFDHMAKGRHIGKVVVTMEPDETKVSLNGGLPLKFDTEAAYLITGGLGGFGLETAAWMTEHGAKHLYLMSRSGAKSEAAQAGIRRLKALGGKPIVVMGDVTDFDDVQSTVEQIVSDGKPLRGVIHAAVVYDDGLIPQLDESRMAPVLAPKVQGAWNLHQACSDHDLDFFTLFSTISYYLGNVGQANYVAANGFLNALANVRRSKGLPCQALSWGVLGGAGLVERNRELQKFFESAGTPQIPLNVSLEALGNLLRKDEMVIGFAAIDWNRFGLVSGNVVAQPRIDVQAGAEAGGRDDRAYREALAAPKSERPAIIARYLTSAISRVLKIDPERIEPDLPLQDLGLDSLTGLQLKNRAETEFRTTLQVATFLQRPTVSKLVDVLCKELETVAASDQASSGAEAASNLISIKQKAILSQLDINPEARSLARSFEFTSAAKVSPRIDAKLTRQWIKVLVDQHPVLASRFPKKKKARYLAKADISEMVVERDCRRMSEAAFDRVFQETIDTPINVENGPLYSLHIFKLPNNQDVLMMRAHALVMDGQSMGLTSFLAFNAVSSGVSAGSLIGPAMSFQEFSDWQREFLASPKGRTQLQYWKRKLKGLGEPMALPVDIERQATLPGEAGSDLLILKRGLARRIYCTAEALGVSTFAIMTAVYALLLKPYAKTDDLVMTTIVNGRTRPDLQNTVGSLSNAVALRWSVNLSESGADLARRIDLDVKESFANQDYPMSEVKRELALDDKQALALNQVAIRVFINRQDEDLGVMHFLSSFAGARLDFGETSLQTLPIQSQGVMRDLSLQIMEGEDRIELRMDYDASLFKPRTIKRLLGHYEKIIEALTRNPSTTGQELLDFQTNTAVRTKGKKANRVKDREKLN